VVHGGVALDIGGSNVHHTALYDAGRSVDGDEALVGLLPRERLDRFTPWAPPAALTIPRQLPHGAQAAPLARVGRVSRWSKRSSLKAMAASGVYVRSLFPCN